MPARESDQKFLVRLPEGLGKLFDECRAEEQKMAPPFSPEPSRNEVMVRLVANYCEQWQSIKNSDVAQMAGAVLRNGGRNRGR